MKRLLSHFHLSSPHLIIDNATYPKNKYTKKQLRQRLEINFNLMVDLYSAVPGSRKTAAIHARKYITKGDCIPGIQRRRT